MYKHKKLHTALLLITASSFTHAREIYLQEDFSEGVIPIDWAATDSSGQNALWTYCADPNTGQTNGCPPLWDDALNAQVAFASSTANNGFMTMDSDIYGNLGANHISQLTSGTIDLTGATQVFAEFEGFIGGYTVDPSAGALFQVSNDGGSNWVDFQPYPTLVTGSPAPPDVRWSFNPTQSTFDISAIAAGQANVMLRWQWEGNFEFLWSVDDLVVASHPDLIFADGMETVPIP